MNAAEALQARSHQSTPSPNQNRNQSQGLWWLMQLDTKTADAMLAAVTTERAHSTLAAGGRTIAWSDAAADAALALARQKLLLLMMQLRL